MKKATITLSHLGKEYRLIDDYDIPLPNGEVFGLDNLIFQWEENNYACDCNRSLFIRQQCDKDFREMECGASIELMSIKSQGGKE